MNKLKRILLYFDGDPDIVMLQTAANLAKFFNSDQLLVASVVKPAYTHVQLSKDLFDLAELEQELIQLKQNQIDDALTSIDKRGVNIFSKILIGDPVHEITKVAVEEGFDFLVKPRVPEENTTAHWFGSLDRQLMRFCPIPVAIGRPQVLKGAHNQKVVAAIDYDAGDEIKARLNNNILDMAMLTSGGEKENIVIVHAWSLYGYSLLAHGRHKISQEDLKQAVASEQEKRQSWLEDRIKLYRNNLDDSISDSFQPNIHVVQGNAETVIPQVVKEFSAELLCLGTASRTGIQGMLIGNTSEEILDKVDCTVMVLKPENFDNSH